MSINNITLDIAQRRYLMQNSHGYFTRKMTETINGKYLPTSFDNLFSETMDKVFKGEIKRLIINVPVGMGKTDRAIIATVARGFAIEPKARFLHISYSKELVNNNSQQIKEYIASEDYQELFPTSLKDDTTAKGLWKTTEGGMFRGASSMSAITGFRAGNIAIREKPSPTNPHCFTGAILIDDPLKPDDAKSKTKLKAVNERYETTFKSRLAYEDVPIILIMQRLHSKDMTEYLLDRYKDEWYHLCIPAIPTEERTSDLRGINIPHNLPLNEPVWALKYSKEFLLNEKLVNPEFFHSQLQQKPKLNALGAVLSGKWLLSYDKVPQLRKTIVYVDTSMKETESSDYSVFLWVGVGFDGYIYVLDMLRKKLGFHRLVPEFKEFYNRCREHEDSNIPPPKYAKIEDKVSGTSLIQVLNDSNIQTVAIQRNSSKLARVQTVAHYFYSGAMLLPKNKHWVVDIRDEFDEFTEDDTHTNDDIIDCCVDAVTDNYSQIKNDVRELRTTNDAIKRLPI